MKKSKRAISSYLSGSEFSVRLGTRPKEAKVIHERLGCAYHAVRKMHPLDYTPIAFPRLSKEIEISIFRIVQESVTNVYLHSGSPDARIEITSNLIESSSRFETLGRASNQIS